jgi:glycosidase
MPSNPNDTHGQVERSLKDIDWSALTAGRTYYPSPAAWNDEVLYFLMVDRFSDGKEHGGFGDLNGVPVAGPTAKRATPLFDLTHAWGADRQAWFEAGKTWCGGTLVGIQDKLGYLQRLGVTAVWLSPIFRQVKCSGNYHGYGIQNFLDVDPHFGTRQELKDLVSAAHDAGIRVILDIILNHAGDVFAYQGNHRYRYYRGMQWPVAGFRRDSGDPGSLPFEPVNAQDHPHAWPDEAVWPVELQAQETWTRQGEIRGWNDYPEYLDGDFLSLKDIDHGPAPKDPAIAWDVMRRIHEFHRAPALEHLAEVFKFWLAYADVDGYRIDTVKHMEPGAVRFFANVMHEFAQWLGKERFYLIGEVTGGRAHAVNILNTTGLDAALGINELPDKLEFLVKGWRSPGDPSTAAQEGYFDLFRNSLLDHKHTHQWFGKHVVTMFDDHDQVGIKHKFRFCGDHGNSHRFLPAALGLNLTTAGIPCLYYGTEQAFNGADYRTGDDDAHSDAFLRECMFGGPFGSLQSTGRHFFNERHAVYRFIHDVCALRRQHIALRRGRQYLRKVSGTGSEGDFHYPRPIGGQLCWVVAWSRLFAGREYLCAINTRADTPLTVWATVDHDITPAGGQMTCLLSTDPGQEGSKVTVDAKNGSAIRVTVPPAGFVVYR